MFSFMSSQFVCFFFRYHVHRTGLFSWSSFCTLDLIFRGEFPCLDLACFSKGFPPFSGGPLSVAAQLFPPTLGPVSRRASEENVPRFPWFLICLFCCCFVGISLPEGRRVGRYGTRLSSHLQKKKKKRNDDPSITGLVALGRIRLGIVWSPCGTKPNETDWFLPRLGPRAVASSSTCATCRDGGTSVARPSSISTRSPCPASKSTADATRPWPKPSCWAAPRRLRWAGGGVGLTSRTSERPAGYFIFFLYICCCCFFCSLGRFIHTVPRK